MTFSSSIKSMKSFNLILLLKWGMEKKFSASDIRNPNRYLAINNHITEIHHDLFH